MSEGPTNVADAGGDAGTERDGAGDAPAKTTRQDVLAAGGVVGAIAAASCCILPLVLFGLGVGGAWIGNLTALAPYQPIFVAVTLGFLGAGFWQVYRKSGKACARPARNRVVKVALWSATVLVAAAMAFPFVAPQLLGV